MASIKEFNVKIKSLKNTRKITKTMKLVSASKLRKAQIAQANAKVYAKRLTELITRIGQNVESSTHPLLLNKNRPRKKALILIYTSDKGLCGAFNTNATRQVQSWIGQNKEKYDRVELSFCGRRGYAFFRNYASIRARYENVTLRPDFKTAIKIGEEIIDAYRKLDIDEVYLAYNQFFSPISQKTIFEKVLPIDPESLKNYSPVKESASKYKADYIYEPEEAALLDFLIPHFLFFKIYFALLENSAGEHGARMSSMENATKNASKMIDHYTLVRNRVRQAKITTELTEIVAGADALT